MSSKTNFRKLIHRNETVIIELVEENGTSVIKKTLNDIQGLSFLYNEFNILTRTLDNCGAVRGAIRKGRVDGKLALFLEWAEGCSLKQWLKKNPPPDSYEVDTDALKQRMEMAQGIAAALSQIHRRGVVHNDVSPDNIVVDVKKDKFIIKFIDFALAQEATAAEIDDVGEKVMDDICNLGFVFNELFMGSTSADLEGAKPPADRKLPQTIINFVANLLHALDETLAYRSIKDAELDLIQMLELPHIFLYDRAEGPIDNLEFVPGKLYGREKERAIILDAYHRVVNNASHDGTPEMMLISGYSGTGKSALVEELHDEIKGMGGYFVSGNFDQLRRAQPYTALITAFNALVSDIILGGDQATVDKVSRAIKKAVGDQGRVLTDVIPSLIDLIGKQPEVDETTGIEAQNRLVFVIRMFVKSVSKTAKTVIMSIDNLQWADSASIDLIRMLVTDSSNDSFFFIGIYRDNEVTDMHPLNLTLREIEKRNDNVTNIKIGNLSLQDVNRFISDEMGMSQRFVRPLATAVYEQSHGNVFFTIQLLLSLTEERLIMFDRDFNHWNWDEEKMHAKLRAFDNVGDLLVSRVMKCSTGTRNVLQVASAIGSDFDELTVMSIIKSEDASSWLPGDKHRYESTSYGASEVRAYIHGAVREGLVRTTKNEQAFKFMHDTIHQAVYTLLSPDESRNLHLKIGSLVLLSTTEEECENMLFFIVDQLNKGASLIKDENKKIELSKLNLQAAQKAIKSSAYGPATEYLRTGLEYIGEYYWENQYDLSLELFTSLVECLYCTGNYDEIEVLVEEVFDHATCFLDKQRAHACLIKYLTQQGRFQEAIDAGFDGLAQVGEVFPSSISTRVILVDLVKAQFMLFGKSDRYLSNLPPMVNKNKLAAMKIIIDLTAAVFVSNPQHFPVLIIRLLKLSLKYGSCNETVNAYSTYGLVLGTGFGQYRKAYRFGQLALNLARKLETKEWLVHVHLVVYSSIFHWIMHVDKTIEPLRYAQRIGMEAGAVEYAGYSATTICIHSFVKGDDLIALEADMQIYTQQMLEYSIKIPLKNLSPFHQCVLNLMGRSVNPKQLNGAIMREESQVDLMKEESNKVAELNIYVNGMYLAYLFGDYKRAGELIDKMGDGVVGSQIEEVVRVFFYGLTSFALAKKSTDNKKWRIRAMASLKKIKKWCSFSKSNFLQKLLMLKAEKAVLNRRYDKAEMYYCEAIASAAENGFLNDEALAYERHGMYLFEKKDFDAAADRLASAEKLYMKWGAQAKVNHLSELIRNAKSA
eukprot:scaffold81937_cov51-Attheya_sp.AAC.1